MLNKSSKIEFISRQFIGVPYKKNSLIGSHNEKERLVVDFERVDCLTFIEYVEALRISHDFYSFIENLKKVRYFEGIVKFEKRRHFFTDWNELETVRNITSEFFDYSQNVTKFLNKANEKTLIEGLDIRKRDISYVPTKSIYQIIPKLKTGDYCGFYTSKEGLDVNHVGIIVFKHGNIMLRHASSLKKLVIDEDFLKYVTDKEGIIIFRAKD